MTDVRVVGLPGLPGSIISECGCNRAPSGNYWKTLSPTNENFFLDFIKINDFKCKKNNNFIK
jgi:hypothetical protein